MSPAGRRPGVSQTREAILDAAKVEFAKGYTSASVRAIARRAEVDPALVYHYFADKAALFVACYELPADPRAVQRAARGATLDGARIVEHFLAQWEQGDDESGRSFVTLTQAVSSDPGAATALREFLTERVWAHRPGGDNPNGMRVAALVSSQLLGVAWARYVVRMEPIASAPRTDVARWVGPTIERYILTGGQSTTPVRRPSTRTRHTR